MSTPLPRRARQSGLTLLELMIASALGLVLLAALAQLFLDNQRQRRQNQALAGLQDQGRYALSVLTRDLAMAGYWGGVYQGGLIEVAASAASLPLTADCGPAGEAGWAFATGRRVEVFDDASGGSAAARFRCLADTLPGTDAVVIRRVSGQPFARFSTCATASLPPFDTLLKTNGVIGTLLRVPATGELAVCAGDAPLAPPVAFHRYGLRIYHVRDWGRNPGDGLPTLCRYQLGRNAAAGFIEECIAEGVEDLQIVWGIDLDDDPLRTPDRYTSAPSPDELARAVTAEVHLRVRATEPDFSYSDVKTYEYGDRTGPRAFVPRNAEPGPDGIAPRHYYRRVFSTTVHLRNPLP